MDIDIRARLFRDRIDDENLLADMSMRTRPGIPVALHPAPIVESAWAWWTPVLTVDVRTVGQPEQVFTRRYRSTTPDGQLWCESSDAEEVIRLSEGHGCTFEKIIVYQREAIEPWEGDE